VVREGRRKDGREEDTGDNINDSLYTIKISHSPLLRFTRLQVDNLTPR
jgi:hypothetical protein